MSMQFVNRDITLSRIDRIRFIFLIYIDMTKFAIQSSGRTCRQLIAATALLLGCVNTYSAEYRVALVVGNSAYADKPLRNPVNDAELMQRTLKDLGFEVTLLRNADRRSMLGGLRDFEAKARNADVALFFYAGHGTQVGGSNYLIPLQAQIRAESDVPDEAVDAASVLRRIEDAKARVGLVILDACRDNPYASATRSSSRGLVRMSVPTGSIVAYAAAPGETADDGKGSNGLYTEQLVLNLNQSGLDLREVFDRTAAEVERITNGKQRPREDVGLRGRFVLKAGPATQLASVRSEPTGSFSQGDPEEDAWAAAKAANTADGYDVYLNEYPKGRYAGAARIGKAVLRVPPSKEGVATQSAPVDIRRNFCYAMTETVSGPKRGVISPVWEDKNSKGDKQGMLRTLDSWTKFVYQKDPDFWYQFPPGGCYEGEGMCVATVLRHFFGHSQQAIQFCEFTRADAETRRNDHLSVGYREKLEWSPSP